MTRSNVSGCRQYFKGNTNSLQKTQTSKRGRNKNHLIPPPRDNILSAGTKQKTKSFTKMALDSNSVLEHFALPTPSLSTPWEVTVPRGPLRVVWVQLWTGQTPPQDAHILGWRQAFNSRKVGHCPMVPGRAHLGQDGWTGGFPWERG